MGRIIGIGSVSLISGTMKILYPFIAGLIFGSQFLGEFSILYHSILLTAMPIEVGIGFAILQLGSEMTKEDLYSNTSLIVIVYLIFISLILFPFLEIPFLYFFLGLICYSIHVFHRYFLWSYSTASTTLKIELVSLGIALVSILLLVNIHSGYDLLVIPIIYSTVFILLSYGLTASNFVISSFFLQIQKRILWLSTLLLVANGLGMGTFYLQFIVASWFFDIHTVGNLTIVNLIFSPLSILSFPFSVFLLSHHESNSIDFSSMLTKSNYVLFFLGLAATILSIFINIEYLHPLFLDISIIVAIFLLNLILISNSIKSVSFIKNQSYEHYVPFSSVLGTLGTLGIWFFLIKIPEVILIPLGLIIGNSIINLIFSLKSPYGGSEIFSGLAFNLLFILLSSFLFFFS